MAFGSGLLPRTPRTRRRQRASRPSSTAALLLLLTAPLPFASAQNKSPIQFPITTNSVGQGRWSSWFGVTLSLGPTGSSQQSFNVSLSTSSAFSWVISTDIGTKFCEGIQPPTEEEIEEATYLEPDPRGICRRSVGGYYDTEKDTTWEETSKGVNIVEQGIGGVYDFPGASTFRAEKGGVLLDVDGTGKIGWSDFSLDKLDLSGEVPIKDAVQLGGQLVGVVDGFVTEGAESPADVNAAGQVSIQQLTLGLFKKGVIASPTAHIILNGPSQSLLEQDLMGIGIKNPVNTLILGGWDSYRLDMEKLFQVPMVEAKTGERGGEKKGLEEQPAFRMELTLSNFTYTYSETKPRDLLEDGGLTQLRCLVDSTTPWIWLPKAQIDSLRQFTQSKYDEKREVWLIPEAESLVESYRSGVIRFGFEELKGDKILIDVRNTQIQLYLTSVYPQAAFGNPNPEPEFFQFRELAEPGDGDGDTPAYNCILGKAFLSETQLFVNYHDMWFGLARTGGHQLALEVAQAGDDNPKTFGGPAELVKWDVDDPPEIKNKTVIFNASDVKPKPGANDNGNSNGSDSGSNQNSTSTDKTDDGGPPIPIIAGGAGGAALVILLIGLTIFCCLRKRKQKAAKLAASSNPNSDSTPIVQPATAYSSYNPGERVELHNISSGNQAHSQSVHHTQSTGPRVELASPNVQYNPAAFPGPPPYTNQYPGPNTYGPSGGYVVPPPPPGPPPPMGGSYYKPQDQAQGNIYHEMGSSFPQHGPGGQVYYELGDRGLKR